MFKGKIIRHINNNDLTKNEVKIANFIVNNYDEGLLTLSLKEMAFHTKVSNAAITRFFIKLNLSGYKGFLNTIANEIGGSKSSLIENDVQSIIKTKTLIKSEKFELMAKTIFKYRKVKLYSSGFSLYAAMNFKRQLNKINIKTQIADLDDIANIYPDNDIHIFISFSGANIQFHQVLKKLESYGEKTIAYSITSTSKSTIKKDVNEHIHGTVYQDNEITEGKELPTVSSRIMHYILDKLFEEIYRQDVPGHIKLIKSLKV